MVENCMAGYNSCMFAYGQVGTNKKENCGFWSVHLSAAVIDLEIIIPSTDKKSLHLLQQVSISVLEMEDDPKKFLFMKVEH